MGFGTDNGMMGGAKQHKSRDQPPALLLISDKAHALPRAQRNHRILNPHPIKACKHRTSPPHSRPLSPSLVSFEPSSCHSAPSQPIRIVSAADNSGDRLLRADLAGTDADCSDARLDDCPAAHLISRDARTSKLPGLPPRPPPSTSSQLEVSG
ncbi:hypothetical protein K402DRAFT_161024 [Aulographum hederae CBS 113979]|uniref:Uncharacterized protein n=1 Tax=Aulographum hederae CBS 113979 TaxID=1176131 RepID=A0A6G1GSD8_9PEZI|nr:hypothetical protein K402DRAFT_161024 [Aulographum hederae CBS 113979]